MTFINIFGTVQSGITNITPLSNYKVSIYYTTLDKPILISETTSDVKGLFYFSIDTKNILPENIYYLVAELKNIKLLSIIGTKDKLITDINNLVINELTTIVTTYCFNNFDLIYGDKKGLIVASLMYYNFVKINGELSDVIKSSPNANQTNTLQLLNTFSNIISLCIKDYKMFMIVASFTKIIKPIFNTYDIILSIVKNPAYNVSDIFYTSFVNKIYEPYLDSSNIPQAFTIAVKVNNSGNNDYLIGGPANIIFDDEGKAWITNNVKQGSSDSSNFAIVLLPDGKPSPISPIVNPYIIGQGFGIVKYFNNVVMGNYGWGNIIPDGGITIYRDDGTPLLKKNFNEYMYRVQGMTVDIYNNIWICSTGNGTIVVLLNGSLENIRTLTLPLGSEPFSIRYDNSGNVVVSVNSLLIKLFINKKNEIEIIFTVDLGSSLLGLTVDDNDNTFVVSFKSSCVYKVDKYGKLLFTIIGNGISNPWSVTIDEDSSIWVVNFSPNSDNLYAFTHFSNNGEPLTPSTGYTLPSGGDEVLLANGEPLNGRGSAPSYQPLMRQTKCKIDAAGNLWIANNCKPSLFQDTNDNPGGDGICIFIGIAKPNLKNNE